VHSARTFLAKLIPRSLLEDKPFRRFRHRAALLCVVGVLQAVSGCSRDTSTRVKIELADPPAGKRTNAVLAPPGIYHCPPAGAPILQPSATTGHHRVILTWNASIPSARSEDNAVGYCLYRSGKVNLAKENATCRGCEQINAIAVPGTACVDDLVQDGTTYYYVVTAINASEKRSSSSNEIPVVIPNTKETSVSTSTSDYPLCRSGTPSK